MEETSYKIEKLIKTYLKTRKRIQKLLLKDSLSYEEEKANSEYITRLYLKLTETEANLKFFGVIEFKDNLSRWPSKEIRVMLRE
jgi:hypothetical protein